MKWKMVKLGDYSSLIRGITFKPAEKCDPSDKNAFVCMRTKNVQVTLDQDDLIAIPEALIKNRDKILKSGDTLVSSANSWNLVGKCCYVKNLKYPSTAGGFISILRSSNTDLDSRFLYLWFSSDKIQQTVRSYSNQTTNISNLDHKRVNNLQIPLPPLEEQKRIAEILDAADALRGKRRQALTQLDEFLQSTFLDMFGDPVTNPKGWEVKKLGDVVDIVSGITKGRKVKDEQLFEVPYLAVSNVQDRHVKLDYVKSIFATKSEIDKYRLEYGDLLLTEGGDPDKLGRGAIWKSQIDDCIHQNHVFRVRIRDNSINYYYLNWYIGSEKGKRYFLRSAKQTTGIATINMTQLKAFIIAIPSLDLQQKFAAIVEKVEQQKEQMRQQLDELDNLFAALQDRAFKGDV